MGRIPEDPEPPTLQEILAPHGWQVAPLLGTTLVAVVVGDHVVACEPVAQIVIESDGRGTGRAARVVAIDGIDCDSWLGAAERGVLVGKVLAEMLRRADVPMHEH